MKKKIGKRSDEKMAEETFPFDISPMYEGERIRKGEMYCDLAGAEYKGFELVQAASMDEIEDGKVTIIGPDIKDMKEGGGYPIAMIYRVAGEKVEKDLEGIIERRNHDFMNYIQGFMHLNSRDVIWCRVSKEAVKKGLTSLAQIAKATMMLFKSELPFIQKMEAIYITDRNEVEKRRPMADAAWAQRDARARGMNEEDVDTFYGCTLCQSFAPTNVCVVSPNRYSLCGAIGWFDGRAAAKVDPEGPNAAIPKGDTIDAVTGQFSGVNEAAVRLSGGEYSKINLHSFFESPHTSCGCFEVCGFYIPEVDGIGWVDRDYTGIAVNGLPFSTMAGQTGGGKQIIGFLGVGMEYMRSKKFIQADGGWYRTVWVTKRLKERTQEFWPAEMKGKIATEEEAKNLDELKAFLKKVNHPVIAGVTRKVDGKEITQGWAFEVTDDIKQKVIAYIEETGGDIDIAVVEKKLGLTEDQFMKVVEVLQNEGILG